MQRNIDIAKMIDYLLRLRGDVYILEHQYSKEVKSYLRRLLNWVNPGNNIDSIQINNISKRTLFETTVLLHQYLQLGDRLGALNKHPTYVKLLENEGFLVETLHAPNPNPYSLLFHMRQLEFLTSQLKDKQLSDNDKAFETSVASLEALLNETLVPLEILATHYRAYGNLLLNFCYQYLIDVKTWQLGETEARDVVKDYAANAYAASLIAQQNEGVEKNITRILTLGADLFYGSDVNSFAALINTIERSGLMSTDEMEAIKKSVRAPDVQ